MTYEESKEIPESTSRKELRLISTTISDKPNIRITSETQILDTENQELMSRSLRETKDPLKDQPGRSVTEKDSNKPSSVRDSARAASGRSVTVIEKGPEALHKSKEFFSPERKPQGSENGFNLGP